MHLRHAFPEGCGEIHRSRLNWTHPIRPHALAHTYTCKIVYGLEDYPEIFCLNPKLSALAGVRKLPHVYSWTESISLCLFRRTSDAWNSRMILAKTAIPLTYAWLAFFEDWLFSGEWRGGGTHPIEVSPPSSIPFRPQMSTASAPEQTSTENWPGSAWQDLRATG